MLVIDGSHGEGGGQILRNAAAFAALLGKDLGIRNIRAGRSQPGLRRQHIIGLQLLADCCGGTLEGAFVGSQEILFRVSKSPEQRTSDLKPRILNGDTHTAGSICLLLQAALPYALIAGDSIRWLLKGGTNASMAPQYDYWEHVFLPVLLQQLHLSSGLINPTVVRRGFFPKGGGEVRIETTPVNDALPPISLVERGDIARVWIRSFHAGKCPRNVAERMATAAKDFLESRLSVPMLAVDIVYEKEAVASGSGILVLAVTTTNCRLGGSALGSPKLSPQQVGIEAAQELCSTLMDGGCVDEYLQDQLILYMALAKGNSVMITGSLTLHTQTAIWTAEQCCDAQFQIERLEDNNEGATVDTAPTTNGRIQGRHRIMCQGIGFSR